MLVDNVSRRDLLKLGAAGALSLAAPRAAWAQAAGPIVKPLPPEWFTNFGTNAEMRWDAVGDQGYLIDPRALLRPQPHQHAGDRRGDLAAAGRRHRRQAPAGAVLPPARAARLRQRDRVHRVRRQRPELLRHPTGSAGRRDAVEARGDRRRALARRPPARRARARRPAALRRRRHARRARPESTCRGGVDYGHVRRPLPVAKALDDALDRARDERPGAAARPRLPGAARAARMGGDRQHQVARLDRSGRHRTQLAVQHDLLRGLDAAAGQERVRARLGRAGAGRPAARAARPLVVGPRADPPRRRQHRRRRALAARASCAARTSPTPGRAGSFRGGRRPARTSCSRAPPIAAASRSPTASSPTAAATASGPSSGIR